MYKHKHTYVMYIHKWHAHTNRQTTIAVAVLVLHHLHQMTLFVWQIYVACLVWEKGLQKPNLYQSYAVKGVEYHLDCGAADDVTFAKRRAHIRLHRLSRQAGWLKPLIYGWYCKQSLLFVVRSQARTHAQGTIRRRIIGLVYHHPNKASGQRVVHEHVRNSARFVSYRAYEWIELTTASPHKGIVAFA